MKHLIVICKRRRNLNYLQATYVEKDEEEQMGLKCNYLDLETQKIQTCSMKLFTVDGRRKKGKTERNFPFNNNNNNITSNMLDHTKKRTRFTNSKETKHHQAHRHTIAHTHSEHEWIEN